MTAKLAAVQELPVGNLQDIPDMLERMARDMRARRTEDAQPLAVALVVKYDDLDIRVHGLGGERTGQIAEWIGLMTLGIHEMVTIYGASREASK